MHNLTTPLSTINLLSTAHGQTHSTACKQRLTGPTINAKIKVQVGTIFIGSRQSVLSTQRVALRRTEVGDLNDNGGAKALCVAAAVGRGGQFPAGAAAWAGAGAGAYAEFVLGDGGRVAGL
jgi:hypothetical protein